MREAKCQQDHPDLLNQVGRFKWQLYTNPDLDQYRSLGRTQHNLFIYKASHIQNHLAGSKFWEETTPLGQPRTTGTNHGLRQYDELGLIQERSN